jgi:hypothetical protein
MKEEFIGYLKAIGMTDVLTGRVKTIYDFYRGVCPEEITDIFATDVFKEDGGREYENLWFFSQNYMMEAKRFISQDDFDMTPARKHINYWSVNKQDYDFQKATDKSRLYIKITFDAVVVGELKASKNNCDYLREIFKKHVLSNLKQ